MIYLSASLLDCLCTYVMPYNQNCSSVKRQISQIPGICESQYNFQLHTEGLLDLRNQLFIAPSKFLKDCSKPLCKADNQTKLSNPKIIENSFESLIDSNFFSEFCLINPSSLNYAYQCNKSSCDQPTSPDNLQKSTHYHNLSNKATASALLSIFQSRMVAASFDNQYNENLVHEKITKTELRNRLKPPPLSADKKEVRLKCLSDILILDTASSENGSLVTNLDSNQLSIDSDDLSTGNSTESLPDIEHTIQTSNYHDEHAIQTSNYHDDHTIQTSTYHDEHENQLKKIGKRNENGTDTGYSSRCSTPTATCVSENAGHKYIEEKDFRDLVDKEIEAIDPLFDRVQFSNNGIHSPRNGKQNFKRFHGCERWQQGTKSCYYNNGINFKNSANGRFSSEQQFDRISPAGRYNKKHGVMLYSNRPSNGSNYSFQNRAKPHDDFANSHLLPKHYPKKNAPYSFPPNLLSHYNSYYQLNSQFDLRECIGHFHRKLNSPAGYFTMKRCPQNNTHWRNDLLQDARCPPNDLLTGGQWDSLSQQVWNLFAENQQLKVTFKAKMILKDRISKVIWNVLPISRLFVVGSSLSGFGTNSSDVDMCLMVSPQDLDQRNDAQKVLRLLQGELSNCGFVEKMELITAKVPILKFRDSQTGIDIDLNCNNAVGIRNTHLLNAYSQLDWRVRPLVLVVKMWAQHHQINNAKDMTISSYSLVLMVLHYLQCGVQPRLLPCLHEAFPDKFSVHYMIFRIPVCEKMPHFVSNNKQSLGELFLGFLDYFANKFTYIERAISIRTGRTLLSQECRYVRTRKNDSRTWRFLCIEEPFEMTNTARSVYDEVVFEKVKNVFKESFSILKKTGNLGMIFK